MCIKSDYQTQGNNLNIFTTQSEPGTEAFGLELLAAQKNGFEYIQCDDTKEVCLITDDGYTIGTEPLCPAHTLDVLDDNYPDGVPDSVLSDEVLLFLSADQADDDCNEEPEPTEPTPTPLTFTQLEMSIRKQARHVILNTLEQSEPITPQQADTCLKLATLAGM